MSIPAFIEIDEDDLPDAPLPKAVLVTKTRRKVGETPQRRQQRADARRYGRDEPVPSPATAPNVVRDDEITTNSDLAAVVVRSTLREMAAGRAKPTLRDGLAAQQLLDRRAEKAADRQFMLNLAMAMAGGGRPTPAGLLPPGEPDPDDVIEGDFTEELLAPDHLRAG